METKEKSSAAKAKWLRQQHHYSFRKLPLWGWPEALATEGSSLDLLHPQGHSCYPIPNVRDLGREWAASQAGNILVRAVLGLRSPLTLSQDMCVCRLSCV